MLYLFLFLLLSCCLPCTAATLPRLFLCVCQVLTFCWSLVDTNLLLHSATFDLRPGTYLLSNPSATCALNVAHREERPVTIMSLQLWRSQDAHGVAETSFPTGASVAETPSAPSARDALPGHEGSSVHEQPLSGSSYGCSSASAISSSTAAQASRPAPSGPASTSGSPRSDEDKGGRSFCQQSGTSVGPHRPHQDVFFRVRCALVLQFENGN